MRSRAGRLQEAEEVAREALAVHRETRNARFEGQALAQLARILTATGRREEAERCLEEALAINRQVGDRRGEASVLCDRARLHAAGGRLDTARAAWAEARAILLAIGRPGELEAETARMREVCGEGTR